MASDIPCQLVDAFCALRKVLAMAGVPHPNRSALRMQLTPQSSLRVHNLSQHMCLVCSGQGWASWGWRNLNEDVQALATQSGPNMWLAVGLDLLIASASGASCQSLIGGQGAFHHGVIPNLHPSMRLIVLLTWRKFEVVAYPFLCWGTVQLNALQGVPNPFKSGKDQ